MNIKNDPVEWAIIVCDTASERVLFEFLKETSSRARVEQIQMISERNTGRQGFFLTTFFAVTKKVVALNYKQNNIYKLTIILFMYWHADNHFPYTFRYKKSHIREIAKSNYINNFNYILSNMK